MSEQIKPTEPHEEIEVLEEKPRILKSALYPAEIDSMRLGPNL